MKFNKKNVLVYGMSISGEWAAKLLKKLGAVVFIYDDDISKLTSNPGYYVLQDVTPALISQFDALIVSPSIEKTNPILIMAKENNVKIFSEVELASQFCKNFVAITGTNGKTTTVELTTQILNAKHKAISCGNIGYPLSRAVLQNKKAIKVVEVSSFMLENCQTFHPHVATVLNIQPDHLVRHKTMENYTQLKLSIFNNLGLKDYSVVNIDLNLNIPKTKNVVTYSYKKLADVYYKEGAIYLHSTKLFNVNQLKLKGKHNIYNVMCAIAIASIFKVKPQKIVDAVIDYTPKEFRNQFIGKINNINFVNDSKSTNIASTLSAVESLSGSIILLVGGSNKSLDYSELFNKLSKRVKLVVAFGEIKEELNAANTKFNMILAPNLKKAFDLAIEFACANDTILLSPATASYDQYSNFIERGEHFNKLVKEYETKKE